MGTPPRKPTGRDGVISMSATDARYLPRTLPERKEEIELLVARKFASYRSPDRRINAFEVLGEPTQNPTDDFDFTLQTSSGPKYLELMEAHFSDIGEAFPTGQYEYEPYRVAERLFENMKKKSDRYQSVKHQGIVLLTYSTYWQFALSNAVHWLLAHRLQTNRLIFESIYHMSLGDLNAVDLQLMFPTNVNFTTFDAEKYRENRDILFDPGAFKIERG
jgi:hypothetical protein